MLWQALRRGWDKNTNPILLLLLLLALFIIIVIVTIISLGSAWGSPGVCPGSAWNTWEVLGKSLKSAEIVLRKPWEVAK